MVRTSTPPRSVSTIRDVPRLWTATAVCARPRHDAEVESLTLPPTLVALMADQGGVFTRAQGVRLGVPAIELDRRRRAGQLVAVRRGVYADADHSTSHLQAASARRLITAGDVVISHGSAACLLGYRLLGGPPRIPALTVARQPDEPALRLHHLHTAGVPTAHRMLLHPAVPITSPARTVADCARGLSRDAALVVADSALGARVSRAEVLAILGRCVRWTGVVGALEVVRFADGQAESALESLARQWFLEQGLPAPQLQLELCDAGTGMYVARVDFIWRKHRTVCEVDGRLKYAVSDATRPGDALRDPLFLEKRREDDLRGLGLEVVRGYWSDGRDRGQALAGRLRDAFARGAARTDPPRWGVLAPRTAERTA